MQIEIQIVETHESSETRISIGIAACRLKINRTLLMYYLEKNRLGLSLRGTPPTAKQVAAKAARVLHETAFRQSALGFAKVIEGYDNASRLRDALRRFGIISHAPGTAGTG